MFAILAFGSSLSGLAEEKSPPNIVFLLVDDLGWADLGAFGESYYESPNIDQLAASGTRFTQAYAACPVCSPTRASILTGRHPVRVGITDWIPGARVGKNRNPKFQHVEDRDSLALEELTLAEVLKPAGYQTFFAGKWHLGSEGALPTDQGFDINIGGHHKGSPPGGYYAPYKNPYLEAKSDGEYLTERLTEETVSFIENRQKDRPFFAYLSYYNVHTPIQPYRETVDHFRKKAEEMFDGPTPTEVERRGKNRTRRDNPEYASMISAVDRSVGSVMSALKEQGIEDNTIVVFFSDNGGLSLLARPGPTSNLPLRAGKGWLYEGGIREPMIVRAPGWTQPGSVCDLPVVSTDFFPTLLELAGVQKPSGLTLDGMSIASYLKCPDTQAPDRTFYWHYPHYHGSTWTPGAAIRQGEWKLIEFYEFDEVELYRLDQDLGERHDLSRDYPEKLANLRQELKNWQTRMGAQMPVPNPDYVPE